LKFSAYYETAKFAGDQSDLLDKLEYGGILKQGIVTSYIVARHTSFSIVIGGGRACASPQI